VNTESITTVNSIMSTCTIDWTMISAIISAILSVLLMIQTNRIAKIQQRQEERAQKIALYDKRYEIYRCFLNVFRYSEIVFKDGNINTNSGKEHEVIRNLIADDYHFFGDRSFKLKENECYYMLEHGEADEKKKADMDLMYLHMDLDAKVSNWIKDMENILSQIDLCFEGELQIHVMQYLNSLREYIRVFRKGSSDSEIRDNSKLKEAISLIHINEVQQKMKEQIILIDNAMRP